MQGTLALLARLEHAVLGFTFTCTSPVSPSYKIESMSTAWVRTSEPAGLPSRTVGTYHRRKVQPKSLQIRSVSCHDLQG